MAVQVAVQMQNCLAYCTASSLSPGSGWRKLQRKQLGQKEPLNVGSNNSRHVVILSFAVQRRAESII